MLPREREIIRAIKELNKEAVQSTPKAISQKTRIPKSEVQYFCERLEKGYFIEGVEERVPVTGDPRHGYRVTLQGYKLLPKAEELLTHLASFSERG